MIEIKLMGQRQGTALIDDEFEHLLQYKWRINVRGYVHTNLPRNGAKIQTQLTLHHAVLGKPPKGKVTDHKNRNRLDNRTENLRHCTHSQNGMNRGVQTNNTLGIKGVSPSRNKFRACIWLGGKSVSLGTFDNPTDAHKAYKTATIKNFKEYASA